jgi:hypothetical protein
MGEIKKLSTEARSLIVPAEIAALANQQPGYFPGDLCRTPKWSHRPGRGYHHCDRKNKWLITAPGSTPSSEEQKDDWKLHWTNQADRSSARLRSGRGHRNHSPTLCPTTSRVGSRWPGRRNLTEESGCFRFVLAADVLKPSLPRSRTTAVLLSFSLSSLSAVSACIC